MSYTITQKNGSIRTGTLVKINRTHVSLKIEGKTRRYKLTGIASHGPTTTAPEAPTTAPAEAPVATTPAEAPEAPAEAPVATTPAEAPVATTMVCVIQPAPAPADFATPTTAPTYQPGHMYALNTAPAPVVVFVDAIDNPIGHVTLSQVRSLTEDLCDLCCDETPTTGALSLLNQFDSQPVAPVFEIAVALTCLAGLAWPEVTRSAQTGQVPASVGAGHPWAQTTTTTTTTTTAPIGVFGFRPAQATTEAPTTTTAQTTAQTPAQIKARAARKGAHRRPTKTGKLLANVAWTGPVYAMTPAQIKAMKAPVFRGYTIALINALSVVTMRTGPIVKMAVSCGFLTGFSKKETRDFTSRVNGALWEMSGRNHIMPGAKIKCTPMNATNALGVVKTGINHYTALTPASATTTTTTTATA